jgi:hypothetical protein
MYRRSLLFQNVRQMIGLHRPYTPLNISIITLFLLASVLVPSKLLAASKPSADGVDIGHLPALFVPYLDQSHPDVRFVSRSVIGSTLFFAPLLSIPLAPRRHCLTQPSCVFYLRERARGQSLSALSVSLASPTPLLAIGQSSGRPIYRPTQASNTGSSTLALISTMMEPKGI